MKLLLDQNLSRKLVGPLEQHFPGIVHLGSVLSINSSDQVIWQYAAENGFAIVSKDDDFEQRSILLGHPPKVIWIRLGNCRTSEVQDLLASAVKVIEKFGTDDEKSLLVIP